MALPFLPEEALGALRFYYESRNNGERKLWRPVSEGGYGLLDSYNEGIDFHSDETIAIGHGPMLLLIENFRSGLIWKYFMRNRYIRDGLERVGYE
jgi:hypothetical protein